MLVDFSVENFGPFRDKASFSLLRTALDELPENLLRCDALVGDGILNSAVLFGPNSSGKSSAIYAIKVLQAMVSTPMPANTSYPWYRPYRLSAECSKAPTTIEIRFTIGTVLFAYGISFDRYKVTSEHLYQYPSGHKSAVFVRKGQEFTIGRNVSKGQKAITRMTNPSSSYLAVAAQFNIEICLAVHRVLTQDIMVVAGDPDTELAKAAGMIERSPVVRSLLLRALDITDFGITDIESDVNYDVPSEFFGIDSQDPFGGVSAPQAHNGPSVRMLLKHRFLTHDTAGSSQYFPIQLESRGTRQMITVMANVVEALYSGKALFIDEFASDLHPEVAVWIVAQFKRRSNPNRAQIVVSTNDHMLMDTEKLFRRDQVFFTRKDSTDGSAEIYSLYDYEDSFDQHVGVSAKASQTMPFISTDSIMSSGHN